MPPLAPVDEPVLALRGARALDAVFGEGVRFAVVHVPHELVVHRHVNEGPDEPDLRLLGGRRRAYQQDAHDGREEGHFETLFGVSEVDGLGLFLVLFEQREPRHVELAHASRDLGEGLARHWRAVSEPAIYELALLDFVRIHLLSLLFNF